MAQFFSWRFWAAIGAVAALGLLLFVVTDDDSSIDDYAASVSQENRRIDIANIVVAATADNFSMKSGYSRGYLNLQLDAARTMRILPATPGDVQCKDYLEPGKCSVVADLLGDAVVWFAIVPSGPRFTIELPPIDELVDGYAVLDNGWEVRYAPVLDRRCDTDTESFSEFQKKFGKKSTSIIDPGENQITAVAC
jgi:hypothetical protein